MWVLVLDVGHEHILTASPRPVSHSREPIVGACQKVSLEWMLCSCFVLFFSTFRLPQGYQIRSDQSLSRVRLFATPWIATRQASLSITNSRSSLRLTSIESVMPSSHLILCHPLLLLPPIPPSIRVFSNTKYSISSNWTYLIANLGIHLLSHHKTFPFQICASKLLMVCLFNPKMKTRKHKYFLHMH